MEEGNGREDTFDSPSAFFSSASCAETSTTLIVAPTTFSSSFPSLGRRTDAEDAGRDTVDNERGFRKGDDGGHLLGRFAGDEEATAAIFDGFLLFGF